MRKYKKKKKKTLQDKETNQQTRYMMNKRMNATEIDDFVLKRKRTSTNRRQKREINLKRDVVVYNRTANR